MSTQKKRFFTVRKLVVTAMFSAISYVLMLIDFSVPIIPSFVKMDFSELPALIAAFSVGPVSGMIVCLVKNLIHLTTTTTGGVGELCNFLLGASFTLTAGLIYKFHKTRKGALVGSLLGALAMALFSIPLNYFVTYPIYTKFLPLDKIIEMYQAIVPSVNGLLQCLVIFNAPFTFFKGIADAAITFLIYKRISPLIHGKEDQNA